MGMLRKIGGGIGRCSIWDPSNFDIIVGAAGDNLSDEDMVVPVAIKAFNVASYAAVIEVSCESHSPTL